MSEPARALYIGRFQIFHIGHVDVLQQICAAPDVDHVLLCVGSPQYDHRHKSPDAPWSVNPFTAAERVEMIEGALAGQVGKPYTLHLIPDLHDCQRWYESFVNGSFALPRFRFLYTASATERALFEGHGVIVRGFVRRYNFHGGTLRAHLAAGTDCSAALPAATRAVLSRIGAQERLGELFRRDESEKINANLGAC